MSDRDTDDFDLISVEIIREESAVITVKVSKGHSGPPPDIFQDSELRCEVLDYLEPQRWFCNSLRTGVCWTPNRKHEHVFDARPLIEKEVGIIPKSVSGSSEGEE
jgi:hypothetical protein